MTIENSERIIQSKLLEYLKYRGIVLKKCGKLYTFICPICSKGTANTVPFNKSTINCPDCNQYYTVLELARKLDNLEGKEDKEVYQHIKEVLKLEITTSKEYDEIYDYLTFYEKNGWDLLPLVKDNKIPVQGHKWRDSSHKSINEWQDWLDKSLGLAMKTGITSGVTVIDIDALTKSEKEEIRSGQATEERKKELAKIRQDKIDKIKKELGDLGNPLVQVSVGGEHLFYKYEESLPKTGISIADVHVDLENDGGYLVIFPTRLPNSKRFFKDIHEIPKMPEELLKKLKEHTKTVKKTNSEEIREAIENENFKVNPVELVNNNLEGTCNNTFIKLGGLLRKKLNLDNTHYVLNVLNKHLLSNPMPYKDINAMMRELSKYTIYDDEQLAEEIVKHLAEMEEASRTEIAMSVVGTNRGQDKKRVDKALAYLVKEEQILKKGSKYALPKEPLWGTQLIENLAKPVEFEMPYLYDVANFRYGDLILIGSQNKKGKCFAKGTGILMYDGSIKNVENIISGDKVMGIDSTARNVLDIAGGKEMMYEIKPNRGESFIVNASHILSLKKVGTNKVINISVKDFLKQSNTFQKTHYLYRVPIEFPKKAISIDPYYLGLWLGDGDNTNVRITTKDKEIINYLNKYAKERGQQVSEYNYSNRCSSYAITSGRRGRNIATNISLQELLQEIGVLNNKHIPFIYKTNCRELRLKLLAGLIDSDGYLTEKKTGYEICIANEKLANDIVYIARSLGFFSYIRKRKAEAKNWNYSTIAYRISILGNVIQIPVKIKRKQALPRKSNRNPLVTAFKIKKIKEDNYYGFTIDGDHLHLIDSFIVNHNTHLSQNIIQQLVAQNIQPYYISLEPGSRFKEIALQLGLKEGDFKYNKDWVDPTQIVLRKNAVTIIDWLMIENKAETDLIFKRLIEQLYKSNGFLIVFMQLKSVKGQENQWFAQNMVNQFPALSCRYVYDDETGEFGYFMIDVIRDPKGHKKYDKIPCRYDWTSKRLQRIDEWEKEKENEKTE